MMIAPKAGFMFFTSRSNFVLSLLILNCFCLVRSKVVAEDFNFEAGFIPEHTNLMVGEPLFVTFFIKNTGTRTVYLETDGDDHGVRSSRFRFKALDSAGHEVVNPNAEAGSFRGMLRNVEILPEKGYITKLYLPFWVRFDHPGEYAVQAKRVIRLRDKPDFSRDYVIVRPLTANFKLSVQPLDKQRMGHHIEKLAGMLDSSNAVDAARQLADIEDDRVVPHLVQIVERNRRALFVPAIEGLGKHPGPESVKALLKAFQIKGDSFLSWKIADALGNMKSPLAVDALVGALNDEDKDLRREAACSLGNLGDKRAIEPLKARISDQSMAVRLASAEALQTLGEPFHKEWIFPIIRSKQLNEFQNAAWFVREHAGSNAPVLLARCLDTENPSVTNYYNCTLTWQIGASGGPKLSYHHDFNHEGTPDQIEENRRTLRFLANWSSSCVLKTNNMNQ